MVIKNVRTGLVSLTAALALAACGSQTSATTDTAASPDGGQSAFNAGKSAGGSAGAPQAVMSAGVTPQVWCAQQAAGKSDPPAYASGCLAGLTGLTGSRPTTLSPSATPVAGCSQLNDTLDAATAPGQLTVDLFSLASNIAQAPAGGQAQSLARDATAAGGGTALAAAIAGIVAGSNLLTGTTAGGLQESPTHAELATIQRMINGLNTAESLCATSAVSWTQGLAAIESSVFSSSGLS